MNIQWLGHSAFKATAGKMQILFDPFLNGNPTFSGDFAATIAGATHVLMTHGHNDHFGDAIEILRQTGATLVASFEIGDYVRTVFPDAKIRDMGVGGEADLGGCSVAMVRADHSSSYTTSDGRVIYGGLASGLILKLGGHSIYHMGDTAAFSDMALIGEQHRPDIVIAPIGDNYTMGARDAALAVDRWLKPKLAIPCHYGTFPVLAQSAEPFRAAVKSCEVWAPAPMGQRSL
jgi:L-ascorbate metabolism protein UlaG (beta-lactamase superfamily)